MKTTAYKIEYHAPSVISQEGSLRGKIIHSIITPCEIICNAILVAFSLGLVAIMALTF